MRNMGFAVSVLGLLVVGACGGDDGGGGGGGGDTFSSDEAAAFCDQSCTHEMTCNGDDLATCTSDCLDFAGKLSASAASDYVDCVAASCTTSEDDCILAVDPSAAAQSTADACTAFETRCTMDTGGLCDLNDPEGGALFRILSDDSLAAVTACFEGACDQLQACLGAALE